MDFSKIPIIILFIVTLTAVGVYGTFNAVYIKRKNVNACDIYLVQVGIGLFCALSLYALSGFKLKLSSYSIITSVIYGSFTAMQAITNALAIKKGPYGFTVVITNGATAITALSGWLLFSEQLTLLKILGIISMLACIMLASDKRGDKKKASFLWLILCILTMIFTSGVGLMQKIHQNSDYKDELMGFLIVAFAVQTAVSFLMYIIKMNSDKSKGIYTRSEMKINGPLFMLSLMVICGVCVALNNCINLYLAGVVDAAVFFPIANGVPLMISLIVSFFVFKERLIKKQIIGFICGLISIVLFII